MEFRTLKFTNIPTVYTQTMSLLFSMFSNLDNIEDFAEEYEIPLNAKPIVDTLLVGLKRNIDVHYYDISPNIINVPKTNSVVVAFSGGKDSVATAIKLKDDGRDVRLFYVSGINKAYPDEMTHAIQIAEQLDLPLHVAYVKQHGKTVFKESPVKNQIIASMALDYAINNNIGCSIAFGDFTSDNIHNSQFFESWSDTQEMWKSWLVFVRTFIPNVELIIPFKTYNETLDIISNKKEILERVCGCILPYRFRGMIRDNNEKKYGIKLLPNRCGSCWKCCTEYIYLVDEGKLQQNKDFYDHCLNFLVRKLPSVRPEISPINKKTAYEAFLHRNFSCSIINK